jgi:hypothetical protein
MRKSWLLAVVLLLGFLALSAPARALASEYDRDEAGNPVRMVGTLAYPAGLVYEYLWLKPVHWLGRHTPFRQVFGQDTFDEAYN